MATSMQVMLLTGVFLSACGGQGSTGPDGSVNCDASTAIDLPVGGFQVIDAAVSAGCIELPSQAAASEYLVVALSGAGQVTGPGVSGGYRLVAGPATLPAEVGSPGLLASGPLLGADPRSTNAIAFHDALRRRESALVVSGAASQSANHPAALRGPPTLGQQEQFNTCVELSCFHITPITATARVIGEHGVIWVDNVATPGAESLTADDLQQLEALFDDYLFPIDTTAFGVPSDIDGSQRIDILITEQVNKLTTDCTNGRVIGYFFGGDLLTSYPGTNNREVFFALAPRPSVGNCPAVSRSTALRSLPPVLIHELQHMISFNQRVLRRGRADEVAWLNEGLSHFAEDLGQLLIPDERCPASASCFAEFDGGNIRNAYDYMSDPEATFLIASADAGLSLAGRGASWLFLRWLADHFSTDTLRGTQLTRALIGGAPTGASNVATATGVPFPTLVGEWLSSLWLDNLPGFQQTGRLRYRTWNFRATFAANSPSIFPKAFPLEPIRTDGSLQVSGTLRGGSGRLVRVALTAGGAPVTVQLTGSSGGGLPTALTARIAVVRTR